MNRWGAMLAVIGFFSAWSLAITVGLPGVTEPRVHAPTSLQAFSWEPCMIYVASFCQ